MPLLPTSTVDNASSPTHDDEQTIRSSCRWQRLGRVDDETEGGALERGGRKCAAQSAFVWKMV